MESAGAAKRQPLPLYRHNKIHSPEVEVEEEEKGGGWGDGGGGGGCLTGWVLVQQEVHTISIGNATVMRI